PIAWSGDSAPSSDTLRFDGSGRATVWLRPGAYRYRLASGGAGAGAVGAYSEGFLPHPVTLSARETRAAAPSEQRSARDWLWLFAIIVIALAGEWLARRRLGLR